MTRLAIRLFGSPHVTFDGTPWRFNVPPRCLPLLAYLALAPAPQPRAVVAAALWPDDLDVDARSNLRRHLHQLRRGLPELPGAAWLIDVDGNIGWNHAAPAEIDVVAFARLVDDPATAAAAVDHYTGDLLADAGDEWLVVERERLRARYGDALLALAQARRRARDFAGAAADAERLLALDDVREDAVREAMAARYESGDRAAALALYERFSTRLKSALGVEPMPETVALAAAIRARAALIDDAAEADDTAPAGWLPTFAGREAELDSLRRAWTRAARGDGATVFVEGEAGIGKSRLIAELAAVVRTQGGRAVIGATADPETEPYQALLVALRRVIRFAGTLTGEPAALAALARVLPEVHALCGDLPDDDGPAGEAGRTRLLDALARCVEAVARARPLLLVLEDLHWAGAGTLDALATLARRAGALPVLIVATYRSDAAGPGHPVRKLRAQLAGERRAVTLALRPLEPPAVARMLEWSALDGAPGQLAETIYRISDGNPLFVSQLAREYVETGALPAEATPAIGSAIAERVARLPERARAVGQVAAALGARFNVDNVRTVGGWDAAWVLDGLDELMDAGMVREAGGAGFGYAFTHALVGAAMYDSAPGDSQPARHRRIARIMEREGDDPAALEEIARHWRLAGDGRNASAAYTRAATAAHEIYARSEAVAFARLAYELAVDDAARFAALRVAAAAPARGSDAEGWEADLALLETVAARLGDAERFVAASLREAHSWQVGNRGEQRIVVREMLALAERLDDRARADAHDAQGTLLLADGDLHGARDAHRAGLAAAERVGDARALARARQHLTQALLRTGEREEAAQLLAVQHEALSHAATYEQRLDLARAEAALAVASEDGALATVAGCTLRELAQRIGDADGEGKALELLAIGEYFSGNFGPARTYFLEASASFERCNQAEQGATAKINLGWVEMDAGRLDLAFRLCTEAADVADVGGWRPLLGYTQIALAECRSYADLHAEALEYARRAIAIARDTGDRRLAATATVVLGDAVWATGDVEQGIELLFAGIQELRAAGAPRSLADALSHAIDALLEAGDRARAAQTATELRAMLTKPVFLRHPAAIANALAAEALARGDEAAAETALGVGARLLAERVRRAGEDGPAYLQLPFNRRLCEASALPR